jgi:hypothetical protein
VRPDPETLERVRAEAERRLSAEEFNAYVNAPMSDAEREEILGLIAWFCRRYPTPLARLEAARRAWRNAQRMMPPGNSTR